MFFIFILFFLISCGEDKQESEVISESYIFESQLQTATKVNNVAVRSMVGGISSGLFKSDVRDFGYYELSSLDYTNYPKVEFFAGEPLLKKCFNKNLKSYLSFDILDFSYCIEANVKLKHTKGGLFISNARLEVLDQFEGRSFYIDSLYSLNLKIVAFHDNESKLAGNPIESIKFSVELFLDGPAGFDARSTDKFQIRADSEELNVLQFHSLE